MFASMAVNSFQVCPQKEVTFSPGTGVMGNRVNIGKESTVYDVYYNELANKGRIYGTETTPVRMPLVNLTPAVPAATPGANDIRVGKESSATIDARDYGKLRAKRGAMITFTGGVYNFSSWDIDHAARLFFAAPTEIRIAGRLVIDKEAKIMPSPTSGITGADVKIFVLGENGNLNRPRSNPKAAVIGKGSLVRASIFVPNGTLWFRKETKGDSAFIAKWMLIGFEVELAHPSGF